MGNAIPETFESAVEGWGVGFGFGLVFLCIYARQCQSVFPWMKPTCWEVDTCCVSILDVFCVF